MQQFLEMFDMDHNQLGYVGEQAKSAGRQDMHLLGPVNNLSKGYIETFGFLVVALTMIQNQDWSKTGGDEEDPCIDICCHVVTPKLNMSHLRGTLHSSLLIV